MENVSIYVHIPFCKIRCGYCDFNTYSGLMHLAEGYVDAVCREITSLKRSLGGKDIGKIKTLYFGGGTPSLLAPSLIDKIIRQLQKFSAFAEDIEITLEVNPGTVDREYLANIYDVGVNRLSIGVQSAHKKELEILDRLHGYEEAVRVVEFSRNSGFDNISLDFIYGLPNQYTKDWVESLKAAISLAPEHLSLYALSVEPGTPLEKKILASVYPMPDEDAAADMYEVAIEILDGAGYTHYEISNWAKRKRQEIFYSMHNLQYWRNLPYIGLGAGAHGFVSGYRTINESFPQRYINLFKDDVHMPFPQTAAIVDLVKIDNYREMQETMMMGLRLLEEGVSDLTFRNRFGLHIEEIFEKEITRLIEKGLVLWADNNNGDRSIKLTKFGYFLANQVFQEFV